MRFFIVYRLKKRAVKDIVDRECNRCPEDKCIAKTNHSRLKCVIILLDEALEYMRI